MNNVGYIKGDIETQYDYMGSCKNRGCDYYPEKEYSPQLAPNELIVGIKLSNNGDGIKRVSAFRINKLETLNNITAYREVGAGWGNYDAGDGNWYPADPPWPGFALYSLDTHCHASVRGMTLMWKNPKTGEQKWNWIGDGNPDFTFQNYASNGKYVDRMYMGICGEGGWPNGLKRFITVSFKDISPYFDHQDDASLVSCITTNLGGNMNDLCQSLLTGQNQDTLMNKYCNDPANLEDPACACYRPFPKNVPAALKVLSSQPLCWNADCASGGNGTTYWNANIVAQKDKQCPDVCVTQADINIGGNVAITGIKDDAFNIKQSCDMNKNADNPNSSGDTTDTSTTYYLIFIVVIVLGYMYMKNRQMQTELMYGQGYNHYRISNY